MERVDKAEDAVTRAYKLSGDPDLLLVFDIIAEMKYTNRMLREAAENMLEIVNERSAG